MPYKVEIPDGSWHSTDDLTGVELRSIEEATGTPWSVLNPFREIGVYQAIVSAFAIRLLAMSDGDIIEWFNARTARQLDAGLKVDAEGDLPGSYEDGVPLGDPADESSTTGSASSPSLPSAGPQT